MLIPLATALVLSMTCQSPSTDREPRRTAGAVGTNRRSARPLRADRRRESHRRRGPAVDREAATPHGTNGGSRGRVPRRPSRASLGRRRAHRSGRGTDEERRLEGGARRSSSTRKRTPATTPTCSRALARAYRRAGDDRRALEYYRRAMALAPDDPDLVEGYEATMRAYGSSIMVEGFAEGGVSDARSVLAGRIRPRPAAARGRGPRAHAGPGRIVGHARRRRRHLANQSLDQPGRSRHGRRGQHLAAERRPDVGGQALPRGVRDRRHRPPSVVRRRRRHRGVAAAGVGHGCALAARRALHLLLVVVRHHRRVLR